MNRKLIVVLSAALLLAVACRPKEPAPEPDTAAPASESPAAAAPEQPSAGSTSAGAEPSAAPSTAQAPAVLASQETNWPGVAAEVSEFRRKGNTLTAKVVFRNHGGAKAQPDVSYGEVYVMDLAAGKKYEVLKDEKGTYIAALRSGWSNRWYQDLEPGETQTIWMKFPAPPAEVKSVTLQVPGAPPFEDLPIQDV
jgi:hypothetical protein